MAIKKIDHYMLPENANGLYKKEAVSSIALAKEVAAKVNEIIDLVNGIEPKLLAKEQEQDGRINKAVLFMKDNLVNSLNDLMVLFRDSGYIDDRIAYHCELLNSRMDNLFSSIKEGSTVLDAEVIDIRTDIYGHKHASAGDAVRSLAELVTRIDQALAEITPTTFDGVEANRVYSYAQQTGTAFDGHNTHYKAVSPGDVYYITTHVVNSPAYRVAMFYNGDTYVGDIGRYEEVGGYVENYKVVIPPGVNKIRVTCREEYTPAIYTGEITERNIPSALEVIENALSEFIPETFDGVEENRVYSYAQQTGTAFDGHNTHYKAVSPGDVYYITTHVVNSPAYRVAMFYNGDTYVGDIGWYEEVGGYVENYKFTVPDGVNKIRVTCREEYTPTITKKQITKTNIPDQLKKASNPAYKNHVVFQGGICKVKAKYNGTEDIVFTISKRGGNNLPDLHKIEVVSNSGPLNSDMTVSRIIAESQTDYFSPHIVAAVNNGDGDNPDSNYFTGGNHQTNNQGSGGTPNARCALFKVYCDNVPVSGSAYGNEITVKWRNYIQGYNTQKEDGTGREILQEDITLTICGTQITADIRHIALEDVKRSRYYGLQMTSRNYGNIEYIGGQNRAKYATDADTNSGDKNCRAVKLSNGNDSLEIGIYNIDLGDFSLCTALDYSAFNVASGKCYFNIIRIAEFAQAKGERTTTRGYYKFASEE